MTIVFNYDTKQIEDTIEYRDDSLKWLYHSKFGKFLLPVITYPLVSELLTLKDRLPLSKKKIKRFCEIYAINLAHFKEKNYYNFAQFFIRCPQGKYRPIAPEESVLAVADAKLSLFKIDDQSIVNVKGQSYHLDELLQDSEIADYYKEGWLCLYRLSVEDVHRYLFAESGILIKTKKISGKLHSIREMVQKLVPVFKENKRTYAIYDTKVGYVLQMEVGALLVGAIHNHTLTMAIRGQEKGYFSLGGSTIIILYQKDVVGFDSEILKYNAQGIEVQVKMGQSIGFKKEKEACYPD